ncbi:hypothetical protein [Aeromicrobium sp. Leaf350]|uniref:hypothetical protein n=1 Tax=Aeromicrobium sp. Leaf350 TaxID=2876565 RepID=UPI001E37AFCA|nr:hypothetical protein [Aeromicrobium sp. Leaf350]
MRVYLAADADDLARLAAGEALENEQLLPASEDEEDELAALEEAAETGPVAVAAEVGAADDPVLLRHVAAFHLALDDSGHLQWFGADELDEVRALLG